MIYEYLKWDEQTVTDFCDDNINSLYNQGYVFTRLGLGTMQQTRSIRINLPHFKLSSENRRVLKKIEGLDLQIESIPYKDYDWSLGKMAKDFYDTKFKKGIFSANKIKEILTDSKKSNFNTLFVYNLTNNIVGYAICYANSKIVHYSYPFYTLNSEFNINGMGMMIMAIIAARENNKKYIYLGSAQRKTDVYKLQFKGLEWFDGQKWISDTNKLKSVLKNQD